MKKYFLSTLLLCLIQFGNAQKINLFNGKDLTGWTAHGTEKWYVESYKNFDFTVQFKQESNGNSGVFFRSGIEGVKISGWQVEVAPPDHHTGGIYESYGRGWLIKPNPTHEKYLKADKWNTLRIQVIGDKVTTWLNGHMMIDLNDEKIGKGEGFIALQIHDGGGIKVRWRKFKIKVLD